MVSQPHHSARHSVPPPQLPPPRGSTATQLGNAAFLALPPDIGISREAYLAVMGYPCNCCREAYWLKYGTLGAVLQTPSPLLSSRRGPMTAIQGRNTLFPDRSDYYGAISIAQTNWEKWDRLSCTAIAQAGRLRMYAAARSASPVIPTETYKRRPGGSGPANGYGQFATPNGGLGFGDFWLHVICAKG